MFETLYRCLYWRKEELALIGITQYPEVQKMYYRIDRAMNYLEKRLGYVPAT